MANSLDRLDRLWRKHRRTFWILHSTWALASGIVVLWLARERYDFVYWVVGFLLLTWVSTVMFSRHRPGEDRQSAAARLGRGLASYLTRILYQETLFFLLPFYAYSTVFPSWNVVFLVVLGSLAVLSCLDLVFDRWLRESPVFSLVFFASVTFAAMNLLLPMLFSIDPSVAPPVAAVTALVTAAPLAIRGRLRALGSWLRLGAVGLATLVVALWVPYLVPPTPLRLEQITFAAGLDRSTLEPTDPLHKVAASAAVGGELVVIARVFAPTNVPARIVLDWYRDRSFVRSSREVEILANANGFRFWDRLRTDGGTLPPGGYRVVVRTADHRVFGSASILLR